MIFRNTILAFTFCSATVQIASANCEISNYKTDSFENLSLIQQVAFLHTVNETTYEEVKRDANASALVPAGFFSGDYAEFKRNLASYSAKFDYAGKLDAHRTWAESSLSKEGLEAYKSCLLKTGGFEILTTSLSANEMSVRIIWDAKDNRDVKRPAEIIQIDNLTDGKAEELQQTLGRRAWRSRSQDHNFILTKADAGSSAFFTIKLDATSKTAYFPAPVIVPAPPLLRRVCSCKGDSSDANLSHLRAWGPEGEKCYGQDGWGTFNDYCKPADTILSSCIGAPGSSVIGSMFFGPDGETCLGISSWYAHGVDESVNPWYGPDRELEKFSQINTRWCPCRGDGGPLKNKTFWGPEGKTCAGQPNWNRVYSCD